MDDVLEALSSRLKSPYFGYAVLAFFALNWREIFLFVTSEAAPKMRIEQFDASTDFWSLFAVPWLVGIAVAASTPWVKLFFAFIAQKPLQLAEDLQLEAEHRKTIRQTELEQARNEQFAVKEEEIIERAKRDEKVASISDEEAKEKVARELEELRRQRDLLDASVKELASSKEKLSKAADELLSAAASDKSGRLMKIETFSDRFIQAAGRKFGDKDQKDFAKYSSALDELMKRGLVKAVGSKDQVFELTHDGWSVSGAL